MIHKSLYSSRSEDWSTPQWLFDLLDRHCHFTLDPCATEGNHKCKKFYTKKEDGLKQSWEGERVFLNPPYGSKIKKWMRKALCEYKKGVFIVALVPARVDTVWLHDYVYGHAEILFLRGRLKFGDSRTLAPFPSMLLFYDNF